MGFFDDDPFDEILKEFFGERGARTVSAGARNVVKSEREERIVDYIEEEDNLYFVFEIPGYSEKDIDINVKSNELEVSAIKENPENVQPYLYNKLKKGIFFRKTIPEKVKSKKMTYHFNNGILEIKFPRK